MHTLSASIAGDYGHDDITSEKIVRVLLDTIHLLPHLRSIRFGHQFESYHTRTIINHLLVLPQIETFSFTRIHDARACIDALRAATHLVSVNIPGANKDLNFLSSLVQSSSSVEPLGWKHIDCDAGAFDMESCKELCKLPSLIRIAVKLSGINDYDTDLSAFSHMPMLSQLDLVCTENSFGDLHPWERQRPFAHRFLQALHPNAAASLTHLTLSGLSVASHDLNKILSHFVALRDLTLHRMYTLTSLDCLPPLLPAQTLVRLTIRACQSLKCREELIQDTPALTNLYSFVVQQ